MSHPALDTVGKVDRTPRRKEKEKIDFSKEKKRTSKAREKREKRCHSIKKK
jgi:hypothetical protein